MSNPRIIQVPVNWLARIVVVEAIASALLSVYVAIAKTTPESTEPKKLFDKIATDLEFGLEGAPLAVQQEARVIRDMLLKRVEDQVPSINLANSPKPN